MMNWLHVSKLVERVEVEGISIIGFTPVCLVVSIGVLASKFVYLGVYGILFLFPRNILFNIICKSH